ncbi:MAG TPA: DUF2330 domain-containing protein [Polyangiaceae bacterium]|jgi:hypothetical protein
MRRSDFVLVLVAAAAAVSVSGERRAAACGGCFHPPAQVASDITDERMLLSVSPTQTTLYDQIRYSGSPSSFAWVLPIQGTVDVGLSADVLFDSIDVLTATQITPPLPVCPPPPPNCGYGSGSSSGGASAAIGTGAPAVTVTKQENVGPYATVQLHATDSSALAAWLAQNGYNIPADVQPVIDAYVTEGFDFLAMKLLPNEGIQAMRPVRVSMPGASLSLPLRMASIGTGAIVGISIWVVGDGRYEPQNFPSYHIDDSQLVWDWSTNLSNYTTLRAEFEGTSHNTAWEIESSLTLNEQLITSVILSGGQYYGGGFGGVPATASASDDYLPVGDPDAGADGGGYQSAEEVRTADVAALFAGMAGPSVRVTRIRSDIAHAAMTSDFVIQASADQSELSNVRTVTQSVNLTCPVYSGCVVVDAGPTSSNGGGSSSGGASGSLGSSGGSSGAPATTTTKPDGGGGCAASAPSGGDAAAEFAAIASMLGAVLFGRVRSRRKSNRG